MAAACVACLADDVDLVFTCRTGSCPYTLCANCVKDALDDPSGENCRNCPMCKEQTAKYMVESVCGRGAVREVERDLRSRVEHEVKKQNDRHTKSKALMSSYEDKANALFLELAELLNMKCPRCELVFDDYDGCNALRCANSSCRAAFCAVCLEDCGSDAHEHARGHGNLFDKTLFEKGKRQRELREIRLFFSDHANEPFEVRELLKIKVEATSQSAPFKRNISAQAFLDKAKASLQNAIQNDRFAVLCNPSIQFPRGLEPEHISPRNRIPGEFRLRLIPSSMSSDKCKIQLDRQDEDGSWKRIPLPEERGGKKTENESLVVDSLINVRGGIQCCTIAFEGAKMLYQTVTVSPKTDESFDSTSEVAIRLVRVNGRSGGLDDGEPISLFHIGPNGKRILGFNPNRRLTMLERHVEKSSPDELVFEPLRAYLGLTAPTRLFRRGEISVTAPGSFSQLNHQQQRVAHPLALKNAVECAGPPGTGKTKTITELIRGVLNCTSYHIIVMSERNGAIDAISEKMVEDCLRFRPSGTSTIKDFSLWSKVLTFGSSGMGDSTRKFTLDEKLAIHPELANCRELIKEKEHAISELKRAMIKKLALRIEELEPHLPEGTDASLRSHLVSSGAEVSLQSPSGILTSVRGALNALERLSQDGTIDEDQLGWELVNFSAILGHLIPQSDNDDDSAGQKFRQRQAASAIKKIVRCLSNILRDNAFSDELVQKSSHELKEAEEAHEAAKQRVEQELQDGARIFMATIGSSHQLPVKEDDDLVDAMERLDLDASRDTKHTIVVFDESGCIPSYEFLGLSRLGRSIKGLVCVGDANQLPPYSPDARRLKPKGPSGLRRRASFESDQDSRVESLLDASQLTSKDNSGGKVLLTTQYRVPRDIAGVLDSRVYKGNYRTALDCKAPARGFCLVHVPQGYSEEKYENKDEVQKAFDIVEELERETKSVMVLTPYKKQQRKLQYFFKRRGYQDDFPNILTIDQCQGQEADFVVISLVQKPTRFLTKNRLNVALSRVRKKLYFLTDKHELQKAANDSYFECHLMLQDLIQLADTHVYDQGDL